MDLSAVNGVIDWYWRFGVKRAGPYKLGPGSWLDQLYRVARILERVEEARGHSKPSVALWGPSQSGKSTLLSRYVDFASGNSQQLGSALQWKGEEKVFFSAKDDAEEARSKRWVILNPYNAGSDASYCISRFVLAEQPPDPTTPVEIRLITHAHLLRFLAHGYHSECDRRLDDGTMLVLMQRDVEDMLPQGKGAPIDPAAYALLHELADIIEALIAAQLERFENLGPVWRASLRAQLLECPALNSSRSAVETFAAKILWDARPQLDDPISTAYKQLREEIDSVHSRFGDRRILCSYRVAKLLLSCDTYHHLSKKPLDGRFEKSVADLRQEIRNIQAKIADDEAKIGLVGGERLFRRPDPDEEFALFQGVIGELVFPLNRTVLEQKAPVFSEFLATADLLDFPGVARYEKTQVQLSRQDLAGEARPRIFTDVLKRGKTAAIVGTAGKIPTIDSFCILSKIDNFPPNTDQLASGVRAWMQGMGHEEWPPIPGRRMPLNLVLTFCGQVVNDVVVNGAAMGIDRAFGKMANLGALADPEISTSFLVTYAEFPDKGGRIMHEERQVARARNEIAESGDFKRRFAGNIKTLDEMIANGGTDYLFAALRDQVKASERPAHIARQVRKCAESLKELLTEASPPEQKNGEVRRREIEAWRMGIVDALERSRRQAPNGDAAAAVSWGLRRLLQVEAEELEPIPLNCIAMVLNDYIESQFARWRQKSLGRLPSLEQIGFDDHAKATRVLGYLCDYAVHHAQIIPWIRANFGRLNEFNEARQARRFLALRIEDALAFGASPRPAHRAFSDAPFTMKPDPEADLIQPRLHAFAAAEEQEPSVESDRHSPHYLGFISPFLQHLEQVRDAGPGGRPAQVGDHELLQLAGKLGNDLRT
jgi:hypothetical protein